jgi:hypothetical protein
MSNIRGRSQRLFGAALALGALTGVGPVGVPATLSISNNEPLRVGGKNIGVGNDQYAGRIDNVFLSID